MFPQILRELRLSKNYTQDYVGKFVNVSSKTVGAWERGTRQPSIDALKKLSKLFNVTTDYLLGNNSKNTAKIDTETDTSPLAAHIDDDATPEELEEIENFIKFVHSKRSKK